MKVEHRDALMKALRWICDPEHYAQFSNDLPRFRRYKTRLYKRDVKVLYRSKKLLKIRPRCSVRSFFVVEWNKKRRRPIFWPDLNEVIKKEHMGDARIPLKRSVRRNGLSGSWSIQFDFKAWYDQLPMHHRISKYFAFDGKHCLRTLPMGFRPACEVAQSISLALADFNLPDGVSVDVYIDNVRFVGERDAVIEAGRQFVERCRRVGAKVDNEKPEPKQEDDFLGEQYDYVNKKRRLAKKTLTKVTLVREEILPSETLTNRQVAAIFGLLFFCSEVLQLPLCYLFNLMKWYRETMRRVGDNWNAEVVVPYQVREELLFWFGKLEANPWIDLYNTINDDEQEPDLTLVVDACETGWGCVSTTSTGTQYYGAPWSAEDHKKHFLYSSVQSEPLGAWRAIQRFVSTSSKKVVVYTDHEPQVWAMQRGIAKAASYNELQLKLKETFRDTIFQFKFINGKDNGIADALSRFGKEVDNKVG